MFCICREDILAFAFRQGIIFFVSGPSVLAEKGCRKQVSLVSIYKISILKNSNL